MKKLFYFLMILLLTPLSLSSCKGDDDDVQDPSEKAILGVWKLVNQEDDYIETIYYYFQEGGKMVMASSEVENGEIVDEDAMPASWYFLNGYLYVSGVKYKVVTLNSNNLVITALDISDEETFSFTKSTYAEIKPFIDKYL